MRFLPPLDADPTAAKRWSWKFTLAVFLILPGVLKAEDKPRVEVWLINTRCAPVSGDWEQGKERIGYWKLGENQHWNDATAASFAECGEKSRPTIFLVHGNRTS